VKVANRISHHSLHLRDVFAVKLSVFNDRLFVVLLTGCSLAGEQWFMDL